MFSVLFLCVFQACQLTISGSGLTVSPRSGTGGTEQHYSLGNILLWDAVQFVVVRDKKKMSCAFEPLDNDHSRNKDNLFSSLDKKLHYLQPLDHPALLSCVIRRTSGIKALDAHVFVCGSCDEALELVRALSKVQTSYNTQQAVDTGVFGYKPFQQAPLPQQHQKQQLSQAGATSRHSAATPDITTPPPAVPAPSNVARRPEGLALASPPAVSQGGRNVCVLTQEYFTGSQLNLSSTPDVTGDAPRRASSPSVNTPRRALSPSVSAPVDTPSVDTPSGSGANSLNRNIPSPGVQRDSRTNSLRSDVRPKTSQAGVVNCAVTRNEPSSRSSSLKSNVTNTTGDFSSRTSSLKSNVTSPRVPDSRTNSLKSATSPESSSRTSSLTSARSLASVLCSPHQPTDSGFQSAATDSTTESSKGSSGKKKNKKDKKEKKSKKAAIVKPLPPEPDTPEQAELIVPQKGKNLVKVLPTESDTLGEGYSLLSGSGGNLPGYNPPRPSPPLSRRHYHNEPSPERYRQGYNAPPQGYNAPPQGYNAPPQGYNAPPPPREPDLDYDYDVDIGLFEHAPSVASSQPTRTDSRGEREHSPVSSHRSSSSSHYPRHQLRPPKSPGYLDRPPVLPPRSQSRRSHEDSPMPVLRPVAMVTPHRTGAGGVRVLPVHHPGKAYSDYKPRCAHDTRIIGSWGKQRGRRTMKVRAIIGDRHPEPSLHPL